MIQNYFKLALRNLLKHKTFSLLNIAGWALGMAVCIVMLLFVRHEKSFDRFHTKADRIYRLTEVQRFEGTGEQQVALSMWPMAETLEKDYPEIETSVRIYQTGEAVLRNSGKQFAIENLCQADSTFFRIFDFKFAEGNMLAALQNETGIVLTANTSRNIFGAEGNAVGKVVELNRGSKFEPFTVAAVLADLPENSHIQFDALIPMHELAGKMEFWMEGWDSNWLVTYLLFKGNTFPEKVVADFPNYEKRYLGTDEANYDLGLQPLADVHLGSTNITHDRLNYKKFDGRYVHIFGWLALFVLLIANFNFINLTTARAVSRSREVGVRKAIGAGRWQLVGQFTGEAVLMALFALAAALVLVAAGLPLLGKVIDRTLTLPLLSQPSLLIILTGAAILTGILSGLYPAFAAARYKPAEALRGHAKASESGTSLRSGLVVAQFSIAVALIAATLLAVGQLNFIRNKNLGFDKNQVVQIPMNATANQQYETLRDEWMKHPDILGVTASGRRLGGNIGQMGARVKINGEERRLSLAQIMVDYNFLDFYSIQLTEGRSFSKDFAQDKGHSFIVNEAFVKEVGAGKLIGQPLRGGWQKEWGSIIGVTKDFNFNSLHHKVAPMCISIQDWDFSETSVKINPLRSAEALRALELEWAKQVPDLPFRYTFLDEHFDRLYKTDTQVGQVVSISSLLAILIACMGLFGLAMFVVQTRTKEIGIRKVLGASVAGITGLLAKDFLKLVGIAIVIASPPAYFFMQKWLSDFAYRIDIQWWVFAVAGAVAIAVAFLTVSFQSVKAALANPVKSLRSE